MQYIKLWAQNKSQVWPKLGHTCDFMLLFNPDIPIECNFNMLSQKYQLEQIELDDKIKMLKEALTESRQTVDDAKKWIVVVKQYSEPTELTAELLNNMIEKIVIHEAIKYENSFREQKIPYGVLQTTVRCCYPFD